MYLEYCTFKKKNNKKYKKAFEELKSKISNFKFTSLFKEKLTQRIEKITSTITKYEKEIVKICMETLKIPKKELIIHLKDGVDDLTFINSYIKKSKLDNNELEIANNQILKYQKKLKSIEDDQDITIAEIKKINKERRSRRL